METNNCTILYRNSFVFAQPCGVQEKNVEVQEETVFSVPRHTSPMVWVTISPIVDSNSESREGLFSLHLLH